MNQASATEMYAASWDYETCWYLKRSGEAPHAGCGWPASFAVVGKNWLSVQAGRPPDPAGGFDQLEFGPVDSPPQGGCRVDEVIRARAGRNRGNPFDGSSG